jgi:hypothetical protein
VSAHPPSLQDRANTQEAFVKKLFVLMAMVALLGSAVASIVPITLSDARSQGAKPSPPKFDGNVADIA